MPRTVTALFDNRTEAETARGRLVAAVKTHSTRIIARDTAGAVEGLNIDPKNAQAYRDAIRDGCHLLVAEVAPGQDPKRVIAALEQSVGSDDADRQTNADSPPTTYGVKTEIEDDTVRVEEPKAPPALVQPPETSARPEPRPQPAMRQPAVPEPDVQEERIPLVEEELRVGTRQVSRGGARVRSVIRETPAQEQVALSEEYIDVENRPSQRRLSLDEVKAGGLLKERIFEIREMREEPVITKEAFVREEVIVRKTVQQRTETITDTVRRTDVEVEELPARAEPERTAPARDEPRRGFFGGRGGRK
jgi:stress response protein YsnF